MDSRKKKKLVAIGSILVCIMCFAAQPIFESIPSDKLEEYKGTVTATELVEIEDGGGWSDILMESTDFFHIYIDSQAGPMMFSVEVCPEAMERMQTIKKGDELVLLGGDDWLGRDRNYANEVRRGEEVLIDENDMQEFYENNHFKWFRIIGIIAFFVALFEIIWYLRTGKEFEYDKSNARTGNFFLRECLRFFLKK